MTEAGGQNLPGTLGQYNWNSELLNDTWYKVIIDLYKRVLPFMIIFPIKFPICFHYWVVHEQANVAKTTFKI